MRRLFRVIARRNNQPGTLCCIRCGKPINDFSDDQIVTHDYVLHGCAAFVVEHRACVDRPLFSAAAARRWREAQR
ncbi:hypothetical protein N5J77_20625 [Sphingobium yanoikuyae]|jgi:hypothetical protein|uniref:Uncharacterized protein n=2 Tax=Sphingomonadaceae TaxID=41297 RepID=A0AA43BBP9_SPHYA|nr:MULTISPECIES: hypothetical protein [Sphingomonadales]MEA3541873.1 hypothetical protein [Pseudomonadota bacterium]MBM7405013.1 hypothetical protein [Sphingomonas sp. JUb134]MDH2133543.1 hypothetical protein [Sphingobium yanoikuyae]MDH2152680.1 hypothetical protein [Sphingobium yanoikuyae]MDH2168898.1 hypothetical protein [Sphingobium yanoikuyae]